MWWIAGLVAVVLTLVTLIAYIMVRCPGGGLHKWHSLGQLHGQFDVTRGPWKATVDGYVELAGCAKCPSKKAYKWVDMRGGDLIPTDPCYVEHLMRQAGHLKDKERPS